MKNIKDAKFEINTQSKHITNICASVLKYTEKTDFKQAGLLHYSWDRMRLFNLGFLNWI